MCRPLFVHITSIFGLVAMQRQAAYASSKGAVVQLTRVLALEFAQYGIRVNEDVVGRVPRGRFGDVWEIVGPTVFLASRASSFVTGTVLTVDGGLKERLRVSGYGHQVEAEGP